MKTQIILRTVLVVVALFVTFNNNGSNVQTTIQSNTYNLHISSLFKKSTQQQEIKSASLTCAVCAEHTYPYVPEPNGDHEFHSFHFRHNEKRTAFWKSVANKVLAVIYYVVVLVAYLPYKLLS